MNRTNKPLAFLDLETTGLYAGTHEIIEACVIIGQQIFHVKVQPEHIERAQEEALQVNGYNPKGWESGVSQKYLAQKLALLLDGCIIVGHNPRFDFEFIECLFEEHDIPIGIDRRAIDTVTLAHLYLAPMGLKSLSMDSIRAFLGWEVRLKHNALDDARDVQRLYEMFTTSKRFGFYLQHYIRRIMGL